MLGAGSTYGRARLPFASGSANNVSAKDYLRARQTNTAENLGHSSSQGHIFEFDWLLLLNPSRLVISHGQPRLRTLVVQAVLSRSLAARLAVGRGP
jgi:hypothetical protein